MAITANHSFVIALVRTILCLIAVAVIAAEEPCDLDGWVHDGKAPGEEGYHVLCTLSPLEFQIYRGGVMSEAPIQLTLESGEGGLRKKLSALLNIGKKIVYNAQGKDLKWQKQPWTLHTTEGKELEFGKEQSEIESLHSVGGTKPQVLLLFEGGIWRWPTVRVGYERRVLPNAVLRTVARQPALFELLLENDTFDDSQDHLSTALLGDVITSAKPRLVKSETEGKVDINMRSSDQTFLPYNQNGKLQMLHRLTAKLLRAPMANLNEFQVLRYQKGQHYDAHRDYWDPREFPDVPRFRNQEGFWTMRHATLLWYLQAPESGGETWFPRAHGGAIPYGSWTACDSRGEKVSPSKATAVLFYNLQANGDIDEFSWHCGCPVKAGTKWAANSWLSNTPGRPREKIMRLKQQQKDRTSRVEL